MANRILRDWTTSESVDNLSADAERFFTRLIMKADDYGSFYSNPKLIRAALFPLKEFKDATVSSWVNECIEAGLIFAYTIEGKEYLRIVNFGQRLRNMRSGFPQPDSNAQQSAASRRESPPETETKRNEVESEEETETNSANAVTVWPSFQDFWNLYDKKTDLPKCLKKWEKIKQAAREKIMHHLALYVRATPDRQYRKNPLTYLNNESWNDEIIVPQNGKPNSNLSHTQSLADDFARRHGSG